MSKQSSQCERLRRLADIARGYAEVDARENGQALLFESAEAMREAADTITSLWNSLTASEAALNKAAGNWARADAELRENQSMRWHELFGTPERAARTLITVRKECEDIGKCYPSCPFRDAPTCPSNCESRDYDALLEWFGGDA